MKRISILGCGWLGFPLAQALVKEGYHIKGSTTTIAKKELLLKAGVTHYSIELEPESFSGTLKAFLAGSEILIIAIPPGISRKNNDLSKGNVRSFVKTIENLNPFVEQSTVNKLIFISSTSVYGDYENNPILTENFTPNPVTDSGMQLLEIEDSLMENKRVKSTILRFGGLIGSDRNPARFLAGKQNVANPDGAINLIHLEDCIGIIKAIIAKDIWNERFNAVAPFHPTRKEYYTQKAIDQNLIPPSFNYAFRSEGKIIDSEKLQNLLDYRFVWLDL